MGSLIKTVSVVLLLVPAAATNAQETCQNVEYRTAASALVEDMAKHFLKKANVFSRWSEKYKDTCKAVHGEGNDLKLQDGDIIFIGLDSNLYQRVAISTNSWVSHVGIAFSEIDRFGREQWFVYESAPLKGRKVKICDYVGRAYKSQFAVVRSQQPLSAEQKSAMLKFLKANHSQTYHLGFNYQAEGYQFCSKLVHQAYATVGIEMGKFEKLAVLVDDFNEEIGLSGKYGPPMNKQQLLCFWDSYFSFCRNSGPQVSWICEYFGGDRTEQIHDVMPRNRLTVTPASQYNQALRQEGFDLVYEHIAD